MAFTGALRELTKKYGKVAVGVHLSVSVASITGLYVAIKNNVDVESIFKKVGLSPGVADKDPAAPYDGRGGVDVVISDIYEPPAQRKRNRTAEKTVSSGGALALALLCNKALFPVRIPITIALTPPTARFLAWMNLLKNQL